MTITYSEFARLNEDVDRHQGSNQEKLDRHRRACEVARLFGQDGCVAIAAKLFDRATAEGNLFLAAQHVQKCSGRTLGPTDDVPLLDLASTELFALLRDLRDAIRAGSYTHGPTRTVRLRKASGGHRSIRVANTVDRVVARGVKQVIEPLLDPMLSPLCIGSRPKFGRVRALALAETFFGRGRTCCLVDDLRNAYDRVPMARLFQILAKLLPDERIVGLVRAISELNGVAGLPQGSACSPLLLNIYARATPDRPRRNRHPDLGLLRYVDDLLIPCANEEEAVATRQSLAELAQAAGWALKADFDTAIIDLARESATWLGFEVSWTDDGLRARIPPASLNKLADTLAAIDDYTDADSDYRGAVRQAVVSWIGDRGPAFQHQPNLPNTVRALCKRVTGIAPAESRELREHLRRGWERWMAWRAWYASHPLISHHGARVQSKQRFMQPC